MKHNIIIIIIVFAILLVLTPTVFGKGIFPDLSSLKNPKDETATSDGEGVQPPPSDEVIALTLTEGGEQLNLSRGEYIVGCLFAQIPSTYHEQALNAQAVVINTYLSRLMLDNDEISDDPVTMQPFFTPEKAREVYKDKYEGALEVFEKAASIGIECVITYGGEPIYSVYHGVSTGTTNTAKSVWGQDFPYLKSVDSSWDLGYPDYKCTNEMTCEEIRLAMYDYNNTASMPIDYSCWFVNPVKNECGYVESIKAGDSIVSGGDVWRLLDLRSTAFDINFRGGGVFVIETRGLGHGVGLSQYGADFLAREGLLFEDILKHYYSDIVI